jgi:hypothetical protein
MKRFLYFFVLLCCVSLSFGQITVTIGAGAVTGSTSSNAGVIYRSSATSTFDFSNQYFLYTASELAAVGITPGAVITKLAWFKTSAFGTVSSGNLAKWDIFMANTSTAPSSTWCNSNFNTQNTNNSATQVYAGTTQVIPAAVGLVEVTLTTPFTYTGGSLEIGSRWDCSMTSGSPTTGAFQWKQDNVSTSCFGGSNSTSTVTMTSQAQRPQLTVTYLYGVNCSGTPNAGNATASIPAVCPGNSTTLDLTGSTTGVDGLTYQWQSSPTGLGTFTNITGATSKSYNAVVSASTDFRCVVTCSFSSMQDISSVVTVNTLTCLPEFTTSRSSGVSYTSIASTGASATWVNTSGDDNTTNDITLPFNFVFKGAIYNKVNACTNGWIAFGGGVTATTLSSILTTTTFSNSLIAPFGEDLVVTGNSSTNLPNSFKYETQGTAPNRVFIAEWIGMERFLYAGPNLNFQVRLYETSYNVEIVYGTMEGFNGTANNNYTFTTGLRKNPTDFNALQVVNSNYFTTTSNELLNIVPECFSMYTFVPSATFSSGTNPGTPAPANDEPTGAIALPINSVPCTSYCNTYHVTANATASAGIPVCSAATPGTPDDDVWFTFTPTTSSVDFSIFGGAGYDAVVQIFSDAGVTPVACFNAATTSLPEVGTLSGLTTGNTYYIRVYHAGTGNGTSPQISICINRPPTPPVNDDPCGAVTLTPSGTSAATCTPYVDNNPFGTTQIVSATTTLNSSTGNAVAAPSCSGAGTNVRDVWFKFTATADAHGISVTAVPGFDVALQAFSQTGSCGGDDLVLADLGCVNGGSTGATENVVFTTTVGTEYYIRIYRHPSGTSGAPVSNSQFTICIFSPTPACTTNSSPTNGATDVSGLPTLTFNRATYATSYDVYLGLSAASASLVGNAPDPGTGTTASFNVTTLLTANTTYFWYVVPKNSSGSPTGCDANATSFTTRMVPTITSLGSNAGCAGSQLVINGTNFTGATAADITIGGTPVTSIVSNTGTVLTVVVGAGTTGTVTVTIGGYSATSTETYTFGVGPTVTSSNDGPQCEGGTINLMATSPTATSYAWSGPLAYSSTTQNPMLTSITPDMSGTYTVTVTDINNCSASSATTVVVNLAPVILSGTATPSTVACGGSSQLNVTIDNKAKYATFSTLTGVSLADTTGSTKVVLSNVDDAPSAVQNIGFTFRFDNVDYTQYSVSPDGFIKLGSSAASSQFSNFTTSSINIPKVFPYWDDVATGSNGYVKANLIGTAPNRTLVVHWFVTIPRNTTGVANSNFQALLHESTNVVEFIYGSMNTAAMSASVGIAGITPATNFQSITVSSNTVSTTTANDNNADQPASGRSYKFTPASYTYAWTPTTYLDNPAIYNPLASGMMATTSYDVVATNTATGCSKAIDPDITVTVGSCNATLNLTSYIEGYMDGANMRPVLQNSGVTGATSMQCDTFYVELRNSTTPYAVAFDTFAVVGTNGQGTFTFPGAAVGNSYYIAVQHRNALETWSANPVTIAATTNYDFSTGSGQAFGGNMVQIGSIWCMYSGDIEVPIGTENDGNIDFLDYPIWEVDNNNFETGYKLSDLNGDGVVDFLDYPIWEANNNNFVSRARP